jgi:hypothetical protein
MFDLLASSSEEGAAYFGRCREKLNASLPDSEKVHGDAVVMLVVQDGALEHRKQHPGNDFHYLRFAGLCKAIMSKKGGCVLPAEMDGAVLAMACAWFPANQALNAVLAASTINKQLQKRNELYRPDWPHEMHALIAMSTWELGACRLLKMARRGKAVIGKELWLDLPKGVRKLARTIGIQPPDLRQASHALAEHCQQSIGGLFAKYAQVVEPTASRVAD